MTVTIKPGIERRLARLPGVKREVHAAADRIGGRASARLSRDTGNARIEVAKDGTDALVSLVDPPTEDGPGNALAIEFGAYNVRASRYVDGQYVLTGAVVEEATNA